MPDRLSKEELEGYIMFLDYLLSMLKKQIPEIDDDEREEFLSNLEEFETNLIKLKNQNGHLEDLKDLI